MAVQTALEVAGLAGSLRQGSYNRALLRAAAELASPGLHVTVHEIGGLPFYNADLDSATGPAAVAELRRAVQASDGLLIAMPEYNYGVPGVLKNAIDWLSRPPRASALDGKVAAILGAATGFGGTARGQLQLRQSFVFTNTLVLQQPEVFVAHAKEKFDESGNLADPKTLEILRIFLQRFQELIARFVSR